MAGGALRGLMAMWDFGHDRESQELMALPLLRGIIDHLVPLSRGSIPLPLLEMSTCRW